MNLIVNRHLDRSEEQAIYELTLKKQRSKKSTISRRQAEAMQQLASELVPQRKDLDELLDISAIAGSLVAAECLCRCSSQVAQTSRVASKRAASEQRPTPAGEANCDQDQNNNNTNANSGELQRHSSTSTIATSSTSSSSMCSASSKAAQHSLSTASSRSLADETCIKLNQLRLEHLNNELKRRLNQYEYLVAQERAILGTSNRHMFANEGVNNFHLYRLGNKF